MNYSTFEISALWHWIERLFVYQADSPLMMGSIPFALLFIFFLAIYILLKSYSRTAMMMYVICFSLFFAYKVNGMVMWMLPLTACINYAVTQEMRLHEGKARKALLTFVVLVDLALLCYFKYTNFIIGDVVNEMFSTNFSLQSIALPVGISFYTFQAISYAVDTYKRKFDMEVTLLEYCFYLTFFPLLMAGPITRAANLIPRLKRNEQASSRMLWTGLFLIMLGLVKKNMLSDYIAQFNNWVFDAPQTFSGFENLAALFGYPVQIFLDFSGYSDMSIGVAAILGFYLPTTSISLTAHSRLPSSGVAGTSRFPSGSAIMCIFRWVETGRERCACISTTSSPCWWQVYGMVLPGCSLSGVLFMVLDLWCISSSAVSWA